MYTEIAPSSQGLLEFFQRPRARVWNTAVRKLPKPGLAQSGRKSEGASSADRLSRRLKFGYAANGHVTDSLAKDCEAVKQPIENAAPDNAGVEEIKRVLRENLQALLDRRYQGSQNALARASGVAQTTIGNYLRKTYTGHPQLDNIAMLAKALRLPEAYLLLVPGLVIGKRGPMTEAEIEQEVQKRLEARWDAIAREVQGLRVAHEKEEAAAPRRTPHHATTTGPTAATKPRHSRHPKD